jgi:hypothetical protein
MLIRTFSLSAFLVLTTQSVRADDHRPVKQADDAQAQAGRLFKAYSTTEATGYHHAARGCVDRSDVREDAQVQAAETLKAWSSSKTVLCPATYVADSKTVQVSSERKASESNVVADDAQTQAARLLSEVGQ